VDPSEHDSEPALPTERQAAQFDLLRPMIDAAYKEMGELSKKKQDGIVNELKARHINRLLAPIKETMSEDQSATYLELLDEATLPQNSDAVFILGQFRTAMDQFKAHHFGSDPGELRKRWFTVENPKRGREDDDDYDDDDYDGDVYEK
jgi:hypothetical protein